MLPKQVCYRITPLFRLCFLVRSSGYAPDSSVLQTDVMTTSTNSALAGTPRIELRSIGSKPIVLPLHHIPIWCVQRDSNPQPSDQKSDIPPVELRTHYIVCIRTTLGRGCLTKLRFHLFIFLFHSS